MLVTYEQNMQKIQLWIFIVYIRWILHVQIWSFTTLVNLYHLSKFQKHIPQHKYQKSITGIIVSQCRNRIMLYNKNSEKYILYMLNWKWMNRKLIWIKTTTPFVHKTKYNSLILPSAHSLILHYNLITNAIYGIPLHG